MSGKFQFVSAFLCERVLIEEDKVLSAIRMVDVFNVPENAPEDFRLVFFLVASLKTLPGTNAEYSVKINIVRSTGERQQAITELEAQHASMFNNDPSVVTGINIIVQMALQPKHFGTVILEIEVDGQVEAMVPFMLRQVPGSGAEPKKN